MSDRFTELAEHYRQHCEQLQAKIDSLQAVIRRLQNLQPSEVTPEELEAVNEELPGVFVWTRIIAASCRGITKKAGGDG